MTAFKKILSSFAFFCSILLFAQKNNEFITIENQFLKVQISTKGAELKSIKKIKTDQEFLWQGNPKYWASTSPVLFPTVGVSWNEQIIYNQKAYPMKIHGFANKKQFKLHHKTDSEAWFLLKNDDETIEIYPFKFEFLIGFILENSQLKTIWKVKNIDSKEMFFQIGGHTGFSLPNYDENAPEIGFVKLNPEKKEIQYSVKEAGKFFLENPTPFFAEKDEQGFIALTRNFFKNDAVVFENQQAKEIILYDKSKKPLLSVETETPVFALWTANQFAPFLCIEPWFGRADTTNFDGEISEKKWVQKLEPNQKFSSGYTIHIY